MTKDESKKIVDLIKGAYGNKFEINEFTYAAWYKFTTGIDYQKSHERVLKHIETEPFPPSVSEILGMVRIDPELESRNEEIARNQWIAEGNDPSEFKYKPASGD